MIIPEATNKGYAIANEGDGVYINRSHQKRGCVQKQIIQTIKTSCDDIGVVVDDAYGLYTSASKDFQSPPIKDLSRTLKANKHDAGVVIGSAKKMHISEQVAVISL